MTRPGLLVVVSGTGTDVGKTWVSAEVLRALRADGVRVAARKPVQSSEPDARCTDADVLAGATGEPPETVCPPHRWYELAMAPPMAADALGRPSFTIADLVGEIDWPDGVDVGLVEGAGGPRSPLADDGDTVDLAAALAPDLVVLVADAGLGAIDAVRRSVPAFADIAPVVVVLNRFDERVDVHRRNGAWLAERDAFDVLVDPADLAGRLRTTVR